MVPAIAEGVLNVGDRDLGMRAPRHAVHQDTGCNPARIEPFGHPIALVAHRQVGIAAARANDDHLAVGFLRNKQDHPGTVADIADVAGFLDEFRSDGLVAFTGTERHGDSVLDDAFVHILTLGIEEDRRCRLDPQVCQEGLHRRVGHRPVLVPNGVAFAGVGLGTEAPAVAADGETVDLCGHAVILQCPEVAQAVLRRHGRIVRTEQEEGGRRVGRHPVFE